MGTFRVLKRAVKGQFNRSRNLGENTWTRIKRMIWASLYLSKGIWQGLKALRKEQLGSSVIYEGNLCWITNWAGSATPTLAAKGFYQEHCDRSRIRNVHTLAEFSHRFHFGLSFYLNNWYVIDINRKVYAND